ncbi:hypothetical protein ACA910_004511 [Epithemia clementina (nom. ined.)]
MTQPFELSSSTLPSSSARCGKATATTTTTLYQPLKRKAPLSAYNLFFQLERKRILEGTDESNNNNNDFRLVHHGDNTSDHSLAIITEADILQIRAEHKLKRGKRAHRKSHGRISFGGLARTVAKRWKVLDASTRNLLEQQAVAEKQEYSQLFAAWTEDGVRQASIMHAAAWDNNRNISSTTTTTTISAPAVVLENNDDNATLPTPPSVVTAAAAQALSSHAQHCQEEEEEEQADGQMMQDFYQHILRVNEAQQAVYGCLGRDLVSVLQNLEAAPERAALLSSSVGLSSLDNSSMAIINQHLHQHQQPPLSPVAARMISPPESDAESLCLEQETEETMKMDCYGSFSFSDDDKDKKPKAIDQAILLEPITVFAPTVDAGKNSTARSLSFYNLHEDHELCALLDADTMDALFDDDE